MNRPHTQVGAFAVLALATSGVCFSGGSLLQQAPLNTSAQRNPYVNEETAQRAGAKLYRRECASCHGELREGIGHAPPLVLSRLRRASPGAIFWVLRNGGVFRGMPSFSHLPEAQRWQIVTFLLSGEPNQARR